MNAKTQAAMRMLGTAPATPEPNPPPAVPGFDGGARQTPPLEPEDHGAWLTRVLRGEVPRTPK